MPYAKDVVIGVVLLVWVAQRQLRPRPLSSRLLVWPAILALYSLYEAAQSPHVNMAGWVALIVTLLVSLAVGLVRGYLTRLYQENGQWMIAGSWKSLLFWLVTIPIRWGLRLVLVPLLGPGAALHGPFSALPYLFSITGLLAGRVIGIALRHPDAIRQARMSPARGRRL
ncbi:MAG: hypothetical protein K6T81_10935 [Alicyclobacillus macrosporangiidus]|uniref:hypothetical protein n=1 Tax=Alicyclobacillus macrosporangiidus TaxID=392015 RepID=UPI0026EF6F90|nr:hypothetical protein [Alicyclobacillus macrosporangiidus]MCL6599241.1 hypothetical protein [Alicyclobacillus macrosporangiidus]